MDRCRWAEADPLLREYHDVEWGVPEFDSRKLWEMLTLEGFQAGLSWITVLRKRQAFRRAFRNFEPERVARFGSRDVTRLLNDPGIIRSRGKIVAAISGARSYLEMQAHGVEFSQFVWGYVGGSPMRTGDRARAESPQSRSLARALKERGFRYVGPVIVYAWMQAVGMVNDHEPTCFRARQVAER